MSDFYYRTWRERRVSRNWAERILSMVGVLFYARRGEFSSFGSCERPMKFMGIYEVG